MMKIFKELQFYIYVTLLVAAAAIYSPKLVKEKQETIEASVSVLNIVRHGDGSFSVILQDRHHDGLNEEQIDSMLISLISEID